MFAEVPAKRIIAKSVRIPESQTATTFPLSCPFAALMNFHAPPRTEQAALLSSEPALVGPAPAPQRNRLALFAAFLAVTLSFGYFLLNGKVGFDLADEGYLWYGADALKTGRVPIRDFEAYDPGRYCWVAAGSFLFGDGVVSMRAACVLFQCIGVFCGILVASRISHDRRFLFLVAVTLILWMLPRYKIFEQSVALTAIYVAMRLLEIPGAKQHFFAGLFIGCAAFVGRNHGLYNLIAFAMLLSTLWVGSWRKLAQYSALCGAGICIGYLPQITMFIFVPGYFDAFVAMLHHDFSVGSNLPIPVPWPWRVPAEFNWLYAATFIAEGCFYLAVPIFLLVAAVILVARGRRFALQHASFLAAFAVALPYAHYTFSRADYVHLAHSVPALVIGIVTLAGLARHSRAQWHVHAVRFILLCSVPALALHAQFIPSSISGQEPLVRCAVRGQEMKVPQTTAAILNIAHTLTHTLARSDEEVAFLPHWPGLYPATNRFSPFKQIYFIRPASRAEEAALLDTLEKRRVNWLLLQDKALDERDDLRFRHTHPRTFQYLRTHFASVPFPGLPLDTELLHRR